MGWLDVFLSGCEVQLPTQIQIKKNSEELEEKTMPKPSTPSDDSAYKNQESSSEAQYKDWNPLQYGLSKVMCDLFCIHDSVTAGTSAVLQNMEKSQDVLTKNLQKLLNYQTEYILWAIGTVVKPHSSWSKLEQVPSVTELMQELRRLPKSLSDGGFSRELLDWHQDASDLLLARIAVTGNQTSETWPYRIHAVRGRDVATGPGFECCENRSSFEFHDPHPERHATSFLQELATSTPPKGCYGVSGTETNRRETTGASTVE